ncbi:MAG: hypothetical protein JAY96_17705 [Candidatus Thiodiazotropha endolucinida]|nr:hypothetical protein [Candidatus Thiodiazotropha taylori]MCW4250031.1 hypothetical protein [Candidatus Thiodiazotropha endolucinida]
MLNRRKILRVSKAFLLVVFEVEAEVMVEAHMEEVMAGVIKMIIPKIITPIEVTEAVVPEEVIVVVPTAVEHTTMTILPEIPVI